VRSGHARAHQHHYGPSSPEADESKAHHRPGIKGDPPQAMDVVSLRMRSCIPLKPVLHPSSSQPGIRLAAQVKAAQVQGVLLGLPAGIRDRAALTGALLLSGSACATANGAVVAAAQPPGHVQAAKDGWAGVVRRAQQQGGVAFSSGSPAAPRVQEAVAQRH